MKKLTTLLSSIVIVAIFSISCDNTTSEEVSLNDSLSKSPNAGKKGKVTICHYSKDEDSWITINISENAVPAHLAHGDTYANVDGTCGCAADYSQDFSDNADGWYTGGGSGIVSYNSTDGNALLKGTPNGPYTYYGDDTQPFQYRANWPTGGWYTTLDIYLDPNWAEDTGFDFSVSASKQNESHLRDFIFHVGVVNGYGLLVNGSNNADFYTNSYKLLNDNGGNYFTVTTAGWYTFRHVFYDDNGALAVDLQLLDADGNLLWSATRTNAADLIASEVGGSRYGWFTHIDVPDGIMIDNQAIYRGCEL